MLLTLLLHAAFLSPPLPLIVQVEFFGSLSVQLHFDFPCVRVYLRNSHTRSHTHMSPHQILAHTYASLCLYVCVELNVCALCTIL